MPYSRIIAAAVVLVLAAYSIHEALQAGTQTLTMALDVGLSGALAAAALAAFVAQWFTNARLRLLMLLAVIMNIASGGEPGASSAYEWGRLAALIAAVVTTSYLLWKERRSAAT